jgi:Predicted redox protein, regulator of disulfide bond formation
MRATVNWKQNMTFIGSADSGYSLQMDADASVGGDDSGVRPMELLALGLAGCTAMDVISILRKKRQDVTQFNVRVDAQRSKEHPKVFTHMIITYIVTGRSVDEIAVLRSIELTVTKYCPAQFMFAQVVPIDLQYEIYEDEGESERRLTHQGTWQETLPE